VVGHAEAEGAGITVLVDRPADFFVSLCTTSKEIQRPGDTRPAVVVFALFFDIVAPPSASLRIALSRPL
jgi:hypothetical protein